MGTLQLLHTLPISSDDPMLVPGLGDPDADFMIVNLAPGISQEYHRRFIPTSISNMVIVKSVAEKLQSMGHSVYVTNLVKEPVNLNKRVPIKLIRKWLPDIEQEIRAIKPKRILVLGKQVAENLIPNFTNMTSDHGCFFRHKYVDFEDVEQSAFIIPTFRFSEGRTDPMKNPLIKNDLKRWVMLKDPEPPIWTTVDSLDDIPLPPGGEIYIDTEATGLKWTDRITMFGICWVEENGVETIFISHDPKGPEIERLINRINEVECSVTFHNAPFDLMLLSSNAGKKGVFTFKVPVGDTMLAAHLSGEYVRNLKHLTTTHTSLPGPHAGGSFEDEEYLAEDVRSTRAVRDVFRETEDIFAYKLLMRLVITATDMRLRGVKMSRDLLTDLLHQKGKELLELEHYMVQMFPISAEVNWNSPAQVVQLLQNYNVPLTEKTKTGNYSVAEAVLVGLKESLSENSLQWKLVNSILVYRELSKLISGFLQSYLDELDELDCIYPNLKLHGTSTGRLSCANPNIQQIPRRGLFKLCFRSRWKGGLYGLIDLAQAELRVAALLSDDRKFAQALLDGDVHAAMAKLAFPTIIPSDITLEEVKNGFAPYRKASKSTTFGLVYGGSPKGLAHRNGLPVEQVLDVMSALQENCPELMNWIESTKDQGVETLRSGTIFGNRRNLLREMVYEGPGGVKRKAVNTPVQGVASYLALIILATVDEQLKARGLKSRPIFTVHDSVMIEIYPGEISAVYDCVQAGFKAMWDSPIAELPLFREMLPIIGELVVGETWAHVEDTNENGRPIWTGKCSSHEAYDYKGPATPIEVAELVRLANLPPAEEGEPDEVEDDEEYREEEDSELAIV